MAPLHTEVLVNVGSLIWKPIPSGPCAKHTSKGSSWLNWKTILLSHVKTTSWLAPFTSCSLLMPSRSPAKIHRNLKMTLERFPGPLCLLIDKSPAYVVLRIPISSKGHSEILSIWPHPWYILEKPSGWFDPIAHSYWRHWTQKLPWYFWSHMN